MMTILRYSTLVFTGVVLAGSAVLAQDLAWTESEIGLTASVFDTPDPKSFDYISTDPEDANSTLPTAFDDAPPAIPHSIEDAASITLKSNKCLKCHDDQELWGKEKDADEPSPMPQSHYVDLRREPGVVKAKVMGSRYFCLQCHVPQAEVKLLVGNDF
jgi:cytochrome c-type protein NapB